MRAYFFFILIFTTSALFAQKPCYQHSRLYLFNKGDEPRLFTDPLGRRPQFPFLQRENGVTTAELFIKAIRDTVKQQKYERTFKAFDLLLRNSGFHGYKELNTKNVRKVYISPGTIGNLGFYNKETDVINYLYVKLNPAKEAPEGIEAWKLINKNGCFLYILFTCGNAFYPNGDAVVTNNNGTNMVGIVPVTSGNNGNCCRTLTIKSAVTAVPRETDSIRRLAEIKLNHYKAILTPSHRRRILYDTAVSLIRSKDTLIHFRDRLIIPAILDSTSHYKVYNVCRDSMVTMHIPLTGDSTHGTDSVHPIRYVIADTVYEKPEIKEEEECVNNWEISVEAGKSWNAIPRLNDPTQHTQTNGSQVTGTISISKILTKWFHLGVSASYVVLTYQDDINYAGSIAGTYNTIYLGKPIIPVQLFGKFNFGKPVGFQSSIALSIGYSIPTNGKIENSSGTTLTTNPNLKGDFTAALKFGISYFFTCHIGVGASFTGQYFNNKSDLIAYSLYALPIQGGLHFRF
jgi:hypothetical protein